MKPIGQLMEAGRGREAGIGAQTRLIEGRRIVSAVAPASDAQRQGLRTGDILLSPPEAERGPIGTKAVLRGKGCDSSERTLEVRREAAWWPPERPSLRDVRDNSGGNISFSRLGSYFSPGQHLVAALLMRPYLERFRPAPEQIDLWTLPQAVGIYTTAGVLEAMKANGEAEYFTLADSSPFVLGGIFYIIGPETRAWKSKNVPWPAA